MSEAVTRQILTDMIQASHELEGELSVCITADHGLPMQAVTHAFVAKMAEGIDAQREGVPGLLKACHAYLEPFIKMVHAPDEEA